MLGVKDSVRGLRSSDYCFAIIISDVGGLQFGAAAQDLLVKEELRILPFHKGVIFRVCLITGTLYPNGQELYIQIIIIVQDLCK